MERKHGYVLVRWNPDPFSNLEATTALGTARTSAVSGNTYKLERQSVEFERPESGGATLDRWGSRGGVGQESNGQTGVLLEGVLLGSG